jgi:hypothetical protein
LKLSAFFYFDPSSMYLPDVVYYAWLYFYIILGYLPAFRKRREHFYTVPLCVTIYDSESLLSVPFIVSVLSIVVVLYGHFIWPISR